MTRKTARRVSVVSAVAGGVLAVQAGSYAVPPETFDADWSSQPGSCHSRSATATVNSPAVGENILFTLSVTVGGQTYTGTTIDSGKVTSSSTPVVQTVSVTGPCGDDGAVAVYDLWINGYRNSPALPDYLIDQAHAYSVCNLNGSGCVDADTVGLPLDTHIPPLT